MSVWRWLKLKLLEYYYLQKIESVRIGYPKGKVRMKGRRVCDKDELPRQEARLRARGKKVKCWLEEEVPFGDGACYYTPVFYKNKRRKRKYGKRR